MEQIENIDERILLLHTHNDVVFHRGSLLEATRKWWRCNKQHAMEADYVFSVIDNVVREVYTITGCHYEMDDGSAYPHFNDERLVFSFTLAPENIRKKYTNKLLPREYHSGQNPVRYNF